MFLEKKALLTMTTGAPGAMFTKDGVQGDIKEIMFPVTHGIFYFCGFSPLESFFVFSPAHGSDADRQAHLDRYAAYLEGIDSAPVIKYPTLEEISAPKVKPVLYMKKG